MLRNLFSFFVYMMPHLDFLLPLGSAGDGRRSTTANERRWNTSVTNQERWTHRQGSFLLLSEIFIPKFDDFNTDLFVWAFHIHFSYILIFKGPLIYVFNLRKNALPITAQGSNPKIVPLESPEEAVCTLGVCVMMLLTAACKLAKSYMRI